MKSESKSHAEWGFLKNIINIDTFFAAGAGGKGCQTKCSYKDHYKKKADEEKARKAEEEKEKRRLAKIKADKEAAEKKEADRIAAHKAKLAKDAKDAAE